MLRSIKYLMPLLAAVLLVSAACTGGALDNGSSADVILEVVSLDNPAVTAQVAGGGGGLCTLLVEDWNASMGAAPKNPLAIPPFNDLILHTVTVTYNWIDPTIVTPTRVIGLGDTTIPAGGVSSVTFAPISFDDLTEAMQGHTSNLVMVFDATTVEGTHVRSSPVQRQLFVEVCTAP